MIEHCILVQPSNTIFPFGLQVTIIKNLELYGLDPQAVANFLQLKVQASATVTTLPGAKDRAQVQVQGNQIHHLAKLLVGKYL